MSAKKCQTLDTKIGKEAAGNLLRAAAVGILIQLDHQNQAKIATLMYANFALISLVL